jgi:hypothetical protein
MPWTGRFLPQATLALFTLLYGTAQLADGAQRKAIVRFVLCVVIGSVVAAYVSRPVAAEDH